MPDSPDAPLEPSSLGMITLETGEAKIKSARKRKEAGVKTVKKVRIPAVFQNATAASAPSANEITTAGSVADRGPLTNCSATRPVSSAMKRR